MRLVNWEYTNIVLCADMIGLFSPVQLWAPLRQKSNYFLMIMNI